MFERFTERARKAIVLAQEEARRLNHGYVGTEHLLLGLLRQEEGVAARTLNSLGVTLKEAREQIESMVGRGEEGTADQPPFTPRSKKVLEFALREAVQFEDAYAGAGHILLSLVKETNGTAAIALSHLGVTPEEASVEITQRLTVADPEDSAYARSLRASVVRARVEGLLVHTRCGVTDEERALPQALRVDLEYMYRAGEGDEIEETVDYGAVLQNVAGLLEREEFRLLETGMRRVGGHVLEGFPAILEATVRVTKLNVPVARVVSGVSVEATFRR
ncbi:MAG: ATP-dependent Clp protease, ATP-binding subunit ClpC [uncultured Rubrobacteraceae bacterium]|uniref:ATP-dependent Clp protease, ATP-binding subunit ClpC n=1 Tax=uncultured Rubrobacteraceae bacterium TaxID=349277 RepID=A0A6J4R528_9ACTN|nr:MAG: ATP-dependent Clp protease, ATP-binding subunit ClpC [uncultured Rubrobacteraceae bacterium]